MPRVKADASEAKILSYSWYVAPANTASQAQYAGDLIVIGEVQNIGTNTIGNVAIGADAYNSTGGFLASGSPLPPYITQFKSRAEGSFLSGLHLPLLPMLQQLWIQTGLSQLQMLPHVRFTPLIYLKLSMQVW